MVMNRTGPRRGVHLQSLFVDPAAGFRPFYQKY
jgi:hypothetical protein